MDKFRGFPAFPLLFWHEGFLLFQISRLQVDLKKNNYYPITRLLMVYITLMM